ncbi:hypothetical protein RO3G_15316 [Rhizopus delemar RA 99-880]|uniref:Uncharacterized protein n=1 Tax=Rhizopus delemar (strain RA 99-880 / ATCC MYA-4621 / FGSC 9543 / NRRL 43880) TaxID=246409 RepID=I1CQ75_RHIO9|nr:hypothetical protein RO3G_15316 [Rhizopus delemar RA 99-880]|eukprot:EIE90605.1 hypothetical protein RO3G_15316 [Rhizopus delemar RA 99-880]
MRSVLVIFGLLSAFMFVSSLPLGPATLEERQGIDPGAFPVPDNFLDPNAPVVIA